MPLSYVLYSLLIGVVGTLGVFLVVLGLLRLGARIAARQAGLSARMAVERRYDRFAFAVSALGPVAAATAVLLLWSNLYPYH